MIKDINKIKEQQQEARNKAVIKELQELKLNLKAEIDLVTLIKEEHSKLKDTYKEDEEFLTAANSFKDTVEKRQKLIQLMGILVEIEKSKWEKVERTKLQEEIYSLCTDLKELQEKFINL